MGTESHRETMKKGSLECLYKILILCIVLKYFFGSLVYDSASSQNIYFSTLKILFFLPDSCVETSTTACLPLLNYCAKNKKNFVVMMILLKFSFAFVIQLNLRQISSLVCEIGAM